MIESFVREIPTPDLVLEALDRNSQLSVAGGYQLGSFVAEKGIVEYHHILIAPTHSMFDVNRLSSFIKETALYLKECKDGKGNAIADNIVATQPQPQNSSTPNLVLGHIACEEIVGSCSYEEKTTVTVRALRPQAVDWKGYTIGETVPSLNRHLHNLVTRTLILVYPNSACAQEVYRYQEVVRSGTERENSFFSTLIHTIPYAMWQNAMKADMPRISSPGIQSPDFI